MATYVELKKQKKALREEFLNTCHNYYRQMDELDELAEKSLYDSFYKVWIEKRSEGEVVELTESEFRKLTNNNIHKGYLAGVIYHSNHLEKTIFSYDDNKPNFIVTFALENAGMGKVQKYQKSTRRFIEIDDNGNQIGDVFEKETNSVHVYAIYPVK